MFFQLQPASSQVGHQKSKDREQGPRHEMSSFSEPFELRVPHPGSVTRALRRFEALEALGAALWELRCYWSMGSEAASLWARRPSARAWDLGIQKASGCLSPMPEHV